MWGQQTDRPGHSLLRCHAFLPFFNQETRDSFLSYWFSPFQPRCGFDAYSLGQYSLPSFPYSTQTWISLHEVGFPLIVQIMVFVCVASRAEDSKLGRWWSGKSWLKSTKMGCNPDMLPGYLLLWATIHPSPLYASVEVHRTGAPTVRMGLPCSYCHFFAVSIMPAVKSSNAIAKVMPHLTNAALSLMPPINLSNAI